MNICVYGASSDAIDKRYILAGEALGEEIAKRGHSLIFGGGSSGLMGAVARGVFRCKGEIVGVAPSFFNVDGVLYENCTDFIYTETMRERKQIMEDRADAFVMTAGGIGTFEEFFEILTLKQLARHNKAICILNTLEYFSPLINYMKSTAQGGFMKEEALSLYSVFDDPKLLVDFLESYTPKRFSPQDMKYIKK